MRPTSRRWYKAGAWLLAVILLWVLVPPFHVRPLKDLHSAQVSSDAGAFDAAEAAQRLWSETRSRTSRATPLDELATALVRNPETAATQYGRRIGIGGPAFYFAKGEGLVKAIDRKGVLLSGPNEDFEVLLLTGPVFSNALRDAPGLIDIKDFSSFEFNALSMELNRLAETQVQPTLVEVAKIGSRIRFAGCGTVDTSQKKSVLRVVAISVEALP